MRRDEAFRQIAELRGDAIVCAAYASAFEWMRTDPHPLNYYSQGAMGQTSSHGLGFALGAPHHKVIVIEGDGSLLMNLSCLVTIANAAPKNLVHFVAENGCYEVNGGHPTPGQGRVSFAKMAEAAGYPHVYEFDGLNRFAAELPTVLTQEGPVFATLKIEPGEPLGPLDYTKIHNAEARRAFREAIKPILAKGG
jgi:sulfopyruvate decarboxylase subunit beta